MAEHLLRFLVLPSPLPSPIVIDSGLHMVSHPQEAAACLGPEPNLHGLITLNLHGVPPTAPFLSYDGQ